MTWGLTIAAIAIVSLIAMVWLCLTAPEGFEDEDGFHLGKPGDDQ